MKIINPNSNINSPTPETDRFTKWKIISIPIFYIGIGIGIGLIAPQIIWSGPSIERGHSTIQDISPPIQS